MSGSRTSVATGHRGKNHKHMKDVYIVKRLIVDLSYLTAKDAGKKWNMSFNKVRFWQEQMYLKYPLYKSKKINISEEELNSFTTDGLADFCGAANSRGIKEYLFYKNGYPSWPSGPRSPHMEV